MPQFGLNFSSGPGVGQLSFGTRRPRKRSRFRSLARLVVVTSLLTFGLAAPLQANSAFLTSKKAVSAPAGFQGVCDRYTWACAASHGTARALTDGQVVELARRVNARVNRQVREISDERQYRVSELWALPTSRGGDCEDFALLKKLELMRQGVSPDRLLIATALTPRGEAHAVLILRTDRGDLVLDNLTSRIKPWEKTGYSFLRMQNPEAPERWRMVLAGGMFGAQSG